MGIRWADDAGIAFPWGHFPSVPRPLISCVHDESGGRHSSVRSIEIKALFILLCRSGRKLCEAKKSPDVEPLGRETTLELFLLLLLWSCLQLALVQ